MWSYKKRLYVKLDYMWSYKRLYAKKKRLYDKKRLFVKL